MGNKGLTGVFIKLFISGEDLLKTFKKGTLHTNLMIIYTDGSCQGNPGSGGYASIVKHNSNKYIIKGGSYAKTTSQRMELTAVYKPIYLLSRHKESYTYSIIVYSDSKYLVNGVNLWLNNWEISGWKTLNKQNVKNTDLWKNIQKILPLFHDINFKWIKGHAGNKLNNECDGMARDMSQKAMDEKRDFTISDLPKKL